MSKFRPTTLQRRHLSEQELRHMRTLMRINEAALEDIRELNHLVYARETKARKAKGRRT